MTTLSPEIWKVIADTLREYHGVNDIPAGVKEIIERDAEITCFDGGVFVAKGNEFDLFVLPERRGRWQIRSLVPAYIKQMKDKFGNVVVKIHERNRASLRLARWSGFKVVSKDGNFYRLEV